MSTNFAQRAKEIVAKHGSNKKAALVELDALRREQFKHEQYFASGGKLNMNNEIKRGVQVEMEHSDSLREIEERGKMPTAEQFAKLIATDHIKDYKKDHDGGSYYKELIEEGLTDEAKKYAMGGSIAPTDVSNSQLEAIRQYMSGGYLMSSGTPMDSTNRYATQSRYANGGALPSVIPAPVNPMSQQPMNPVQQAPRILGEVSIGGQAPTFEQIENRHSSPGLSGRREDVDAWIRYRNAQKAPLTDGPPSPRQQIPTRNFSDGGTLSSIVPNALMAFGGTVPLVPNRVYGAGMNVYDGGGVMEGLPKVQLPIRNNIPPTVEQPIVQQPTVQPTTAGSVDYGQENIPPATAPTTIKPNPVVNSTQNPNLPLSSRNNNPGNLVDTTTGKFRTFSSPEEGHSALLKQIGLYLGGTSGSYRSRFGSEPVTPERLMETYAPSAAKGNSAESTSNYAKYVAKSLGIQPGDAIPNTPDMQNALAKAISTFEGGAYSSDGKMTTPAAGPIPPAGDIPTDEQRTARRDWSFGNNTPLAPIPGQQAVTSLDPPAGLQIPAQPQEKQKEDWMQYAPAAFNLMAGLTARRGQNMPTNVSFGSITPQIIAPEQLSQAPIIQNINQQYASGVNALSGMGNSAAAMRAGLSGIALAGAQGGGNAIADINMKNASLRGDATKFNAISAGDVAKFNAQMGADAKRTNLANQESNLNAEAAFRQRRAGSLGAFATNLGQVAAEKRASQLEDDRIRALMNMYGYNKYGEKPATTPPKKASDRTVPPPKPSETKPSVKKSNNSVSLRIGGYLKFK